MSADKRLERLRFRSWHRGTREMDLLLGSFADAQLAGLSSLELDQYEALLEMSDPDLYRWMTGGEEPPAAFAQGVMQKMRAHKFAGGKVS